MSSFGGSIKLTGEEEYRRALKNITTGLKEVSSQLSRTTTEFQNSDKSTSNLKKAQQELAKIYETQKSKVEQLRNAYDSFKSKVEVQAQAHQKLVSEDNKEKAELERLEKTVGTTSKEYQDQKDKVEDLGKEVAKSTKNYDDNQNALSRMGTELNKAEKDLSNTAKEMDNLGKETKDTGEGFTVFKGVLADLTSKAIQSALNGLKQLGSALINVGKQAISSYAEYEQLVGGVETLFKDSAGIVEDYANQAYKTAGLSANEYMETVTSFSASLLQSLGNDTKKASEYANRAVIDMSDNANKMGTDMTMIQNAYQGFAKQNYTMLDNLKLGYGGTKTEMQRLIQDASKLTDVQKELGLTVDANDMSFGNIVNAISVVQKEMGIMGTTSQEASSTITGSINSMKSAWQNLLTGLADGNQEIGPLIDNFIESIATSWENLKPRIRQTVEGIKELISTIWEKRGEIKDEIPELAPLINALEWIIDNKELVVGSLTAIITAMAVGKVATFINTMVTLGTTLAGIPALTTLATTGLTALSTAFTFLTGPVGIAIAVITALIGIFVTLYNKCEWFRDGVNAIVENIKEFVINAVDTIVNFFTVTIPEAISNLVQTATDFFAQIPEKVNEMVQNVITFFQELPYNLGLIIGEMIGNIINFGTTVANWVTTTIPAIIESIVTFFSELPEKIWTWLTSAYQKVTTWGENVKNKAIETGTNFINNVVNFFKQLPSKVWSFLSDTINKVKEFSTNIANKGKEGAKNLFNNVVNGIKELPSKMLSMGKNIVEGLWNGIANAGNWIRQKVGEFARGILDGMKQALGIHSPSKVFADVVGKNIALGIGEGFTDEMKSVSAEMEGAIPTNIGSDISINGSGTGLSSYANQYSYNKIVEAFQDALSSMKIELDDEEAGKFVRRTVEDAIYT